MATFTIRTGQGDSVTITKDTITAAEKDIATARAKRNSRLANSDSKTVTDRGFSDSKIVEWKTYRQSLRDMDLSDPDNLTWPTKPE